MFSIYREGQEMSPGINIGWVNGPVAVLFIPTWKSRRSWYFRFRKQDRKFFFEYSKWTLEDDHKMYVFERGYVTREVRADELAKNAN